MGARGAKAPGIRKVLNPKTIIDLAREGRTPCADFRLTEFAE